MADKEQLSAWAEAYYPFANVTLDEVTAGLDQSKHNYIVNSDGTRCAFLTAYAPDAASSDLGNLVEILRALQQKGYPAEQIIPAEDGAPVVEVNGWRLLAKSFIDGFPVEPDNQSFRRVGRLLGRLHTAFSPDELRSLPAAERSVRQQVAQTRAQLEAVRDRVPEAHIPLWRAVHDALGRITACDGAAQVLTHNDFHLTNILNTRANELKVIDWDGAGRDSAVTDLGFLLSSAHPRPQAGEVTQPDAERIEAIVTGYVQHRQLSAAELDCLPDTVSLRVLERLASNLQALVEQDDLDVEHDWWIARFESASETARLARAAFERMATSRN